MHLDTPAQGKGNTPTFYISSKKLSKNLISYLVLTTESIKSELYDVNTAYVLNYRYIKISCHDFLIGCF